MSKANFYIKDGYQHRQEYIQFDDRPNTDHWQKEVYLEAKRVFCEHQGETVVDIGCGSGYKLLEYFGEFKTIGLELEPNYSFLKERYPERDWRRSDLQTTLGTKVDLVICSDVIEHLLDPNELLSYIAKLAPRWVVISTPERDLVRGVEHRGPPINNHHIREWNTEEFRRYISDYFQVTEQKVVGDSNQLIICKPQESTQHQESRSPTQLSYQLRALMT